MSVESVTTPVISVATETSFKTFAADAAIKVISSVQAVALTIMNVVDSIFQVMKSSFLSSYAFTAPLVQASIAFLSTRPGIALLMTGASLLSAVASHKTDNTTLKIATIALTTIFGVAAGVALAQSGVISAIVIPIAV